MLNKDDDKWLANLDKADQDWLRGLAGEKVPGADPNIMRQVSELREAIRVDKRLEKITARLFLHRMARRVKYHFIKLFSVDYVGHWKVAFSAVFVGVILGWLLRPAALFGVISKDLHENDTNKVCPYNFLPIEEPQERVNQLKELFILGGAEVEMGLTTHAFLLEIKMPENPSEELRELCGEIKQDGSSCAQVEWLVVGPKE